MSFVDLATLAMHRRHEMEARINVFLEKCEHAIHDIKKLKMQAKGFVDKLNCEPNELKERFLNCMKQLDEYTYLITDFNLALSKLDSVSIDDTPVQDVSSIPLKPQPPIGAFNLMDALSEPTPSTSKPCFNQCPLEKPMRKKVPKEDQLLIAFSSTSCSSESVPVSKTEKEVQCELADELRKVTLDDSAADECHLPAQTMLQTDNIYSAIIMHVDGLSFWVITDNVNEVCELMTQVTNYYKENTVELNLEDVMTITYCACYDDDSECFYRGLFIRLTEEDMSVAEVFLVDTGETRCTSTASIQPLAPQFCLKPPYARCCHLAGVDLLGYQNKELLQKQEEFLQTYIGKPCKIKIDDNSSESLGVYVHLPSGVILNNLLVEEGLALRIDKSNSLTEASTSKGLPELDDANFDITECPEYEDPLEAVTGYHNKDEIDICKNYKGGPEKTCFKGARCNKRHIMKHPDGWTLDRVEVVARCRTMPLPAPDAWVRVYVTHVVHYDRFYVHLLPEEKAAPEPAPSFGVVLPPTTLDALVLDMNSPAARMAYKPLKMIPAPGEMVAALYPLDEQWYRAQVLSSTRADQNVEIKYIDYGNVVWVKEDAIRELEPRYWSLPSQASRCCLAGVAAKTGESRQWAAARDALAAMIHEKTLQAHVIARDYDEVTVELYDDKGYSIAELLAAAQHVNLKEYAVIDDTDVRQKLVVP